MASTTFQDFNQNNPIVSSWLNDVNKTTYTVAGTRKIAENSTAAWVRFFVAGGVVTIGQSQGVLSVTRSSAGVYVITFNTAMTNTDNVYAITSTLAGFNTYTGETTTSVTIQCTNTSNVPTDPGSVCVTVHGNN